MSQPPTIPDPRPRAPEPLSDDVVNSMLAGVADEIFPTGGGKPSTRWSEWPTSWRIALVFLAALALGAGQVRMMGIRPDWAEAWQVFCMYASVLVVGGAWSAEAALRPMWRRAATLRSTLAIFVLPTVIALLPWPGMHTEHGAPLMQHVMCGGMGSALGFVATLPMLVLSRGRVTLSRAALIATAGGCLGFVVQNLICPLADVGHLVFAHGVAGMAIFGMLALGLSVRR